MPTLHVEPDGAARELHELVPSVSITHLLQQRGAVLERLEAAFALIREAYTLARGAKLGFPRLAVSTRSFNHGQEIVGEFANAADVRATCESVVDAGAWSFLMSESGMRSLLSASKRQEFDEQVDRLKSPPLTMEAIEATFRNLHQSRGAMFDEGVIDCFKRLSWEYRTNLPHKFGKRIILRGAGQPWGDTLHYRTTDELDDLLRVFHVLDGKPETDHRHGCYVVLGEQARKQPGYPKVLEHPYFTLKVFKNCNGHVTFKRLDLIDTLNAIIAKHYPGALPAAHC